MKVFFVEVQPMFRWSKRGVTMTPSDVAEIKSKLERVIELVKSKDDILATWLLMIVIGDLRKFQNV
jgi:hypothetical protein